MSLMTTLKSLLSGTLAVSLKTKPNKPNPTTTKQTKSSRPPAAFFVPLREKNAFPLTGKEIVLIFAPENKCNIKQTKQLNI